jgi:serine protease Do
LRPLIIIFLCLSFSALGQQTAQNLFSHHQAALFQIRIIELGSGNKSSIGSGFQIDQQGHMVTNYHVISDYVFHPDKFRIEFQSADGKTGPLQLSDFDVVNDLALVKRLDVQTNTNYLTIAAELPEQGSNIYSLGNPHDLGMIVVPGTFNGLTRTSFYQRIHFTGAINPGMSGGPVVNQQGEVVGVNVATAGNQIGFLVPLTKLQTLLKNYDEAPDSTNFKEKIRTQLMLNQKNLITQLTATPWSSSKLGHAEVPDGIADFISCWGNSNSSDKEAYYLSVENRCQLDEQIYLHNNLRTGTLEMEFESLSSDELNSHRFYNFYSQSIAGAGPGNAAGKSDVTNFQCQHDIVQNKHQATSKTVLCLRAYKDFAGLYDVLFIAANIDDAQQGLISHFTLAGVDKSSALTFTRQFMDSIIWH